MNSSRRSCTARAGAVGAAACVGLLLAADDAAAQTGAPGAFEIDELAAERALERALVQSGSVVLAPRTIEIVPFLGYTRFEGDTIALVEDIDDGTIFPAEERDRQNLFDGGLILRAGLPWSAQFELTVPIAYSDVGSILAVDGTPVALASRSIAGFGDVVLTYSQALREEGGGLPTVIGSISWDTATGRDNDALSLGSGFHEVQVALAATLSQDPLVFSGRVGYQRSFERDGVRPGDQISFGAATFLAVNPETSLSFGFSLTHGQRLRLDGERLDGTDLLAASLDIGLASVLRRNVLLSTTLSIGLTEDAPSFGLSASVPITFTF